jgi:hypothetical protein
LARSGSRGLKVLLNSKFMRRRAHTFRVLFAVACVTSVELGPSAQHAAANIDIGKSQIGTPPSEFDLSQGQWNVVGDATAAAGLAIEQSGAQTTEGRFPLAIYKPASLKNADISLRINAAGGTSDRGGGVAVRLSSPQEASEPGDDPTRENDRPAQRRRHCRKSPRVHDPVASKGST